MDRCNGTARTETNAPLIVEKIDCIGRGLDRERYKNYYFLRSGERFDEQRHADALKSLALHLEADGYFKHELRATIHHNTTRSSVDIVLTVNPGPVYHIKQCSCVSDDDSEARLDSLAHRLVVNELYGQRYKKGLVDHAVRILERFFRKHGFFAVQVSYSICPESGHTVGITFSVVLGLRRVLDFCGHSFFSSEQLFEQCLSFGRTLLVMPVAVLIERLIHLYKTYGFFDVSVSCKQSEDRCCFIIEEGERALIQDIVIIGGASLHSCVQACFEPLKGMPYQCKALEKARQRCIERAMKNGFWDCALAISYERSDVRGWSIVVNIDQGRQRVLHSVLVERAEVLGLQIPACCVPCPFDLQILREQRDLLLASLHERGYLHARPVPLFNSNENGGIDLVWRIDGCDRPVRFGKTVIVGQGVVPRTLFERELAFSEGDVWSTSKVAVSRKNLKRLSMFERIDVYPSRYAGSDDLQNMVVQCVEGDAHELKLRAGIQCVGRNVRFKDMDFRAGGTFLWNNPSNRADMLSFDVNVTPHEKNVVALYSIPWLASYPIKTDIKAYSTSFDQPVARCSIQRLYRLSQDGVAVSLCHESERMSSGVGVGLEWMEVSKISEGLARAIDFCPRLVDCKVPQMFCEPMVLISTLDDVLYPSHGTLSLLSCKLVVPLDSMTDFFASILAQETVFFPLSRICTIGVRMRLGYIFNRCFSRIMPSDRFYLGGAYSVRGYEADLVPPVTPICDWWGQRCFVPMGGKSLCNCSLEARFSVLDSLALALFTDLGALGNDAMSLLDSCGIVGASGFGLRYRTPFGPVRFDIGWKWKPLVFDPYGYAWYITLGQSF